MRFTPPLLKGRLIKRYKRFLADIRLDSGEMITAHCPNSGSMRTTKAEGIEVWVSQSDNPKRKLAYTWELARVDDHYVMIHAAKANDLIEEALQKGYIPELIGYERLQREVKYGIEGKSRIDFLVHYPTQHCYIEVKSVSLYEDGILQFPDAVTERGQKHLRELMQMRAQGHRAVLLFAGMHMGSTVFQPADHIDPEYGRLLREAARSGVEILGCCATITADEVHLIHPMTIVLDE